MAKKKTNGESKRLSDEQLTEIVGMLEHVDSVELKLTIPTHSHRATVAGLPIDPVEAEPRQAFFFDTPDLALNRAGVVVRARRIRGGTADTVVKLRPVDPRNIPEEQRASSAFKIELDAMPGGFVCSASFKGRSTGDAVKDVAAGKRPLSKILSREQRAFYEEHAPATVALDSLVVLGPTFLLKSQLYAKKLGRKVAVEMWLYPDGTRILEVSTRSEPAKAFQVAVEFRAYLAKRGLDAGGLQETKTKSALEYFTAELQALARAEAAPSE